MASLVRGSNIFRVLFVAGLTLWYVIVCLVLGSLDLLLHKVLSELCANILKEPDRKVGMTRKPLTAGCENEVACPERCRLALRTMESI